MVRPGNHGPSLLNLKLGAHPVLKQILLRTSHHLDVESLLTDLESVADALTMVALNDDTEGDDLSELESEKVPEEVRKWLASTFAKTEQVVRKKDERPTFRSVANAIRTGIFIEKIYRRMSTSQLMVIPENLNTFLEVEFFISQELYV